MSAEKRGEGGEGGGEEGAAFIHAYILPGYCRLYLESGAYLGFCQRGCTFLADLPAPPPPDLDLDPDPDQDFELDPDPHQNNADPQPCWAVLLIYFTRTVLLSACPS